MWWCRHFGFVCFFNYQAQVWYSLQKLLISPTYHILEDKQHYSSRNLNQEDDQHDDEELKRQKIKWNKIKMNWCLWIESHTNTNV